MDHHFSHLASIHRVTLLYGQRSRPLKTKYYFAKPIWLHCFKQYRPFLCFSVLLDDIERAISQLEKRISGFHTYIRLLSNNGFMQAFKTVLMYEILIVNASFICCNKNKKVYKKKIRAEAEI